ncbi:zinc finger BED domain-containing protein RICESLEEPER 2-like [Vicia villosa]|uniref:zinc finger BED domain-containing protein RICESLEEPER 2-like n=1 Tax=Vicia villosa TaxID=3911 RepID=UPI00273B2A38|nr:zinc finger BED domain-containing protein RICESLEEPER 2-like [Vicia villosa]
MVHEHPFSVVENEVWMWAFQYVKSDFHKIGRKTTRVDCLRIHEEEKKILKDLLRNIDNIIITNDTWRSSHQGIGNKIFLVSVNNASYNNPCLKSLKEDYPLSRMLALGGALFHVRCCAHVLNLLVQDGLIQIKDVIGKVRESVKYVYHNDARSKALYDVVEQKGLKDRKLILDCPTLWNSTYQMLFAALKFKIEFLSYKERESHYKYAFSNVDWDNVEKVCQFLEVFNLATLVISGSEYPTSNIYLAEVWRVRQVIDNTTKDTNSFMREMAASMKLKFDKYWGECNFLMAIASVLDPRSKFHIVDTCFPLIYKAKVSLENIKKVKNSLEELYGEYVSLSLATPPMDLSNRRVTKFKFQLEKLCCLDLKVRYVKELCIISNLLQELLKYLSWFWTIKLGGIKCIDVYDVKEAVYELAATAKLVFNWSYASKLINFNKYVEFLTVVGEKLYCGYSGYNIQGNTPLPCFIFSTSS